MPFKFNQELWDIGRTIEDKTLPLINQVFDANFERDDNDIFDVLDFKDENKKIIVEVKGRRIPHDRYEETIITASKITKGSKQCDLGWEVYFVFVFTDKTFMIKLDPEASFKCKFTGTNCIKHYMIPITDMIEIDEEYLNSLKEPIEEEK